MKATYYWTQSRIRARSKCLPLNIASRLRQPGPQPMKLCNKIVATDRRIFTSYSDIFNRCCKAWNKLTDQPCTTMSIGLGEWTHEF